MDLARLIELLPLGLRSDPTERRALAGLLAPVAAVDQLLATRAELLSTLLDPVEAPDDTVRHLGALVGLGTDLGAANAATVAQLRKLIPAEKCWAARPAAPITSCLPLTSCLPSIDGGRLGD